MLKLAIIFWFGVVWGGRLENTYLPPSGARTAGGNGNLLQTPFSNGNVATVVSGGGFDNRVLPSSGSTRIGPNVRKFGSIGNGSFRENNIIGGPNTFGFNGAKPAIAISNGFVGKGIPLSPVYGAPVIPSGAIGDGSSISVNGNSDGHSPAYSTPVQNGIHTNTGSYVGPVGAPVNILRQNNENDGTGVYRFEYETENHISQEERGDLKNVGTNSESSVVQGTYSYAGPDGHIYTVNYIADENGFQPTGEHIHLAVQANAADAARTAAAEGKVGDYSSGGQYQSTANGGYQY